MRDLKIYISLASILFIGYLVAQYNKPKPVDWSETYKRADKIPFGTYVLYNQLPALFPHSKVTDNRLPVYNALESRAGLTNSTYLLLAGSAYIDRNDFKRMQAYMERGNTVFIAAYNFGQFLDRQLKLKTTGIVFDGVRKPNGLRFTDKRLPARRYRFDKQIGWQFFSKFDSARATVLGVNGNGRANFIRFRFGKGALFLVASPQLFTNYVLLKPAGARYAETVFSYFPHGKEVIWDEHTVMGNEGKDVSPLRFISANPPLRNAYYITLVAMLLFVLFEMKRRQRIIPIADPMKNATTEFVQVVGQVYYHQRDNRNIAEKKIRYLLEHIRSRYHVKTAGLDQAFAEMLVQRSGASPELVASLLREIAQVRTGGMVSDQQLIKLHTLIQEFNTL
ncbi:DUF4350 domain-containing protein [Hufsiella ginkgonis]|uniref:DUF4350 domain-containing protein n=1 Tax=Hufsiella ginkgonis TaxID=2695274 RepID=A0A7K1Y2Q6_9SPHI|nr:DUF4350 domain-containing protein [Hufsiella ginkgonis]MXV17555.1 DUF4350 domain-containing protein [Hufsiella ginkgonis]